jgi:Fe2+ or Zn2+ uptake regulation protein
MEQSAYDKDYIPSGICNQRLSAGETRARQRAEKVAPGPLQIPGGGRDDNLYQLIYNDTVMSRSRQANLEQLRQCQELCRRHGLPLTPQRRVVLDAMLGRTDHPSADRVYEETKDRIPGISRMTVYRNLQLLTELGILKRLQVLPAARFDPKTDPHRHLVCVRCEKVMDLPEDPGDAIAMPRSTIRGFRVSEYQLCFLGTCAECRRKERARSSASKHSGEHASDVGDRRRRR